MNRELQGDTLVVRIPMRFKRQGGRKRILAPDGSDLAPPTHQRPDGTLVKALARAWRWQRQLDAGVYASLAEIAAVEKLSPSYVSRIARLAQLAPDIVEAILAGTLKQCVILERLEKGVPVGWEDQRSQMTGKAQRWPSGGGCTTSSNPPPTTDGGPPAAPKPPSDASALPIPLTKSSSAPSPRT